MAQTYSAAALALMARGVTCSSIARALGTSPPSVTRWLRGVHTPPAALYDVIAALGDRDLAEHVRQLVAAAKAEREAPGPKARAKARRAKAAADRAQARLAAAEAEAQQADQRQPVAS